MSACFNKWLSSLPCSRAISDNVVAVAHSTEISVIQGQHYVDDLQTYFPNAYRTSDEMMGEAKDALDDSRL